MEPTAVRFDDELARRPASRLASHEPRPASFDAPAAPPRPGYGIPARVSSAARWFGTGTVFRTGGFEIADGLVFVGSGLSGVWGAAVDTDLPATLEGVAAKPGARTYAQLSMRQRHAFLAWLAAGRRGPLADPCILMAYLANAEQYLLEYDGPREPQQEQALMAELLALHDTYGLTQPLAANQCLLLRDYVWVRTQEAQNSPGDYPELACLPGCSASPALRWVLGQYAAWQAALPAPWAYLWARGQLRGVHLRLLPLYEAPLRQLFEARYAEWFVLGITFESRDATPEEIAYPPMHPGMQGRIIRLRQPAMLLRSGSVWLQSLAALMADCLSDLQHYIDARVAGKTPEQATGLLPVQLWPEHERLQFRQLVANALERPTATSFARLGPFFRATDTLSVRNMDLVHAGLSKLGLACFPPLRRLTKPASPEATLILFASAAPEQLQEDLTALVQGPVGLLLRLLAGEPARDALAAALAAGAPRDASLSPAQQACLPAVWAWLLAGGPKPLTALQWRKLADTAQAAKALTLLPRWCEAPHLLPPTPGLDRILGARWRVAPLALDRQKVAALTQETAEVSQLLGRVFEEPAVHEPVAVPETQVPARTSGPNYGAFLAALAKQSHWPFAAFDALACQHKLMPGAAAEWVNERSYDEQGAPALEEQGAGWDCDTALLQSLTAFQGAETRALKG